LALLSDAKVEAFSSCLLIDDVPRAKFLKDVKDMKKEKLEQLTGGGAAEEPTNPSEKVNGNVHDSNFTFHESLSNGRNWDLNIELWTVLPSPIF